MGKYTLLAVDLDGTLTKRDKTISPHTRETLIRAQQQGLRIILATGRPTCGVGFIADELQMDKYGGYIFSYNGGEIRDWTTKELLYATSLPDDIKSYLYNTTNAHGFTIISYRGDNIVTEDPDNEYVKYTARNNRMPIIKVPDFLKEVSSYSLPKCLIVGEPEPLHNLEIEMQEYFKDRVGVFRSEAFFLEIVPQGVDKAKCLKILLDMIGETPDHLIACGDGFNDISMIKFAGLGVAMANAQPIVRENANYTTLSNEEDGVAYVVEKFFLQD